MSRLSSLKILFFSFFLLAVSSCEKQNSISIDSTGIAPILGNASLSTATINTDSINNKDGLRLPDDILSLNVNVFARLYSNPATASNVMFTLRKEEASDVIASGDLADDGVNPDVSRNDSVYSALVKFQIVRSTVGKFIMEVWAQSPGGYASSAFLLSLQIIRANQPPVLSNLQAPDTVIRGNVDQTLALRITATDADGLGDILKVIFNSFRPTGAPASGNPFQMTSDGQISGTSGFFALTISLPATTDTGTYRFEFQAFDRSNATSNIIIHRITVKQ